MSTSNTQTQLPKSFSYRFHQKVHLSPSPKYLKLKEVPLASARRTSKLKKFEFCCPNCDFALLESLGHYSGHEIVCQDGTLITPLGTTQLPWALQVLLFGLLESYPRPITKESLLSFYEFYVNTDHEESRCRSSMDVQICHLRKHTKTLGLTVLTLWGQGWALKIDFSEAPLVSDAT